MWIVNSITFALRFLRSPWIRSIPETDPTVAMAGFLVRPERRQRFAGLAPRAQCGRCLRPGMPMKCVAATNWIKLENDKYNLVIVLICLRAPSERTEQFSLLRQTRSKWKDQRKMCSSSNQQISQRSRIVSQCNLSSGHFRISVMGMIQHASFPY